MQGVFVYQNWSEHDTNYYYYHIIIIAAISFIIFLKNDLFSINNILHVNYYLLYYLLKHPY
jgi:hypothetical protein